MKSVSIHWNAVGLIPIKAEKPDITLPQQATPLKYNKLNSKI